MKKNSALFFLISFGFLFVYNVQACTTAIISAKASKDGRPLLLKNRDSDEMQNKLMSFNDGIYQYVGLVNSKDKSGKEVWGGFNKAGFGIMNSASYNLKKGDTTKLSDREGEIMKLALQKCATLEDFEKLLKELPKPLGVEANFGVIDALGGAAYYETDNFTFTKFDVNDPSVAPNGYLIRTNYSCSGEDDKGAGYIRYATAEQLFHTKYKNGKADYTFLLNDVARCLKHSLTNSDLKTNLPKNSSDVKYVWFQDYIPRTSTATAIVVQGIKKGEDALLTTMWTALGFPLTSVIIPVWLNKEGTLPQVLIANEKETAPLCDFALKLKTEVFPPIQGRGDKYMNIAKLMNKSKDGIRQKLETVEKEIIKNGEKKLTSWRNGKISETEMIEYYKWVDKYVYEKVMKITSK